jgi:hypothetical protein
MAEAKIKIWSSALLTIFQSDQEKQGPVKYVVIIVRIQHNFWPRK